MISTSWRQVTDEAKRAIPMFAELYQQVITSRTAWELR